MAILNKLSKNKYQFIIRTMYNVTPTSLRALVKFHLHESMTGRILIVTSTH